eukprot:COSAG02_NODE_4199_length_5633_cov_4.504518_8_plen_66_part_00
MPKFLPNVPLNEREVQSASGELVAFRSLRARHLPVLTPVQLHPRAAGPAASLLRIRGPNSANSRW